MLGLHYETPPEWASQVLASPAELLLDHVFCEKKAAAMALHTLRCHGKRFPALKKLMPELAAEEFEHAAQAENWLKEYKQPLPRFSSSPYAKGLRQFTQVKGRDNFLDMLLVCSLIEARSAERFRLLADAARGSSLGGFYEDLYASEVNHYQLFISLSVDFYGEEKTKPRLQELRAAEAKLIQSLPPGPRIHSSFFPSPTTGKNSAP